MRMSNTQATSAYNVLLFYAYVPVRDPEAVCKTQRALCERLSLRGRVLIAEEGINGTLSGKKEDTDAYISTLCKAGKEVLHLPLQVDDFKQTPCSTHVFPRLQVRVRAEVVHAGLPALTQRHAPVPYMSPATLRELLATAPQGCILLDVRDDFEHQLGRFQGAYTLPIRYFRDFKHCALDILEPFKEKKIITYCTGGIRCEKASVFLREHGFTHIHQLHGGIIAYGQQTDGAFFEGSCYVFDARLRCTINHHAPTVIGKCYRCAAPTENMINCAYTACHKQVLLCEKCTKKYTGSCSATCGTHLDAATAPFSLAK